MMNDMMPDASDNSLYDKSLSDRCGNCRFYHALSKSCRRSPPLPILLGITQNPLNPSQATPQFVSVFPPMEKFGWCGEHKPAVLDGQIALTE